MSETTTRELADAPAWMLDLARDGNGKASPPAAPTGERDPIPEGQRSSTLTSIGGVMRRKGLDADEIAAALLVVNAKRCNPPLSEAEVRAIAQSVTRYEPAEAPETFTPISLGELWRADPTLREPMIDGLLRRGQVGNLISTSKSYKTYLILGLAISMVLRRLWLDRFPTAGGRVLVIDLELQRPDITHRTHAIAKALHAPLEDVAAGIDVLTLRGRNATVEHIERMLLAIAPRTYSLVIVDPLYKTYPEDFDENSNAKMTALYRRWERLAEHLDAALMIVHHGTKGSQSEKRVVDVGAGASAQSRSADAHIALREHEEPDAVVLETRVRSFPPADPMVLRWKYPVWERALDLDPTALKGGRKTRGAGEGDTTPTGEPWTAERFAKEYIGTDPTPQKLILAKARAAGMTKSMAEQFLTLAESANLISKTGGKGREPTAFCVCSLPPHTPRGQANLPRGRCERARKHKRRERNVVDPETYILTLRPEPSGLDHHGREPAYRLKRAAKVLLRSFGLRCVNVRQEQNASARGRKLRNPSRSVLDTSATAAAVTTLPGGDARSIITDVGADREQPESRRDRKDVDSESPIGDNSPPCGRDRR